MAEKWDASALHTPKLAKTQAAASREEVEAVGENMKKLEEKWQVIDVDSEDGSKHAKAPGSTNGKVSGVY